MDARIPARILLPASAVLLLLLVLPGAVLLVRSLRPELIASLGADVVVDALRLSLTTSAISLGLTWLFGTPVAYLLARYRFRGRRVLEALLDLPLVLPPVVAGVMLLLVFGRRGLLGAPLSELGVRVAFTTTAVVLAQVFVSAPLYVRSVKAGFERGIVPLERAALTLHASRWRVFGRVTLPLAAPALLEGTVLAWTRALGEFGATIVVAGSLQGVTQTMPLAIYATLERDLDAALAMSAVLAAVAFLLLLAFRGDREPPA